MKDDLMNLIPLDKANEDLVRQIVDSDDSKQVKGLIDLFNLNQVKKNTVRIVKLNSLLDKISDQMLERFENNPHEFTNNDLLTYMTTVQTSIDRANKYLDLVDNAPMIQLNQVNVNVDSNKLNRDSRLKITEAINKILQRSKELDLLNNDDTIIIEGDKNEQKTSRDDNGESSS